MNTNEDPEVRILEQTSDDLEAYGSVPKILIENRWVSLVSW